jgi:ABC-type sugar transport system substrate-binding protein
MKQLISLLLTLILVTSFAGFAIAEEEGYKFAVILTSETDEATISIRTGIEKAAAEYGVELEFYMTDGDSTKIPGYLQMLQDHGCDALIDASWKAEVGMATEEVMKAAGIPMVTCDVEYGDYAHLVGANNYLSGKANGVYVSEWVKNNWDSRIDYVIAMYGYASGDGVKQRLMGCLDILEEDGLLPDEDHITWFDASNTEVAYNMVMGWLQGNPEADHVYIINNNDSGALGSYNAVLAMQREPNCMITSYNCDSFALEHFATTEDSSWKASCNFNLAGYGDIAVPALLDILETGEDNQPHELNTQTFMVDRVNVVDYYKG